MMYKREKKRAVGRALACLLTAAALALSCGCAKKETREAQVEKLTGRERVKAEVAQVLRGVNKTAPAADNSLDLTLSVELGNGAYRGVDLNDYLKDSAIALRAQVQEDRVGLDGDVTVMGQRFIGGTAIYDDGVLGFQVPELDSTYYTIDLKSQLSQTYEGRQYLDMLERMENMGPVEFPAERVIAVTDRYIDLVADTANEDNTVHNKRDSFDFDKLTGETHTGQSWVFTPTAQDMERFLDRLANELEGDEALKTLLLDYLEWATGVMGRSMDELGTPDELRAQLDQEFAQAAQSLRDSAADAGAWVEEARPVCTLYTAKGGAWKMEASAYDGADAYRLCAEGGKTGFAFWVEGERDGRVTDQMELVCQYEKTDGAYNGTLTYTIDSGYQDMTMELEFQNVTDRVSALGLNYGNYTLTIPNLGKLYLDVTRAEGGGTDHVLSLDSPLLSQECARNGLPDLATARLTLRTTDRKTNVSTPQGPTRSLDLAHMDYAEMDEIFGPWEQRLEDLTRNLAQRVGAAQ